MFVDIVMVTKENRAITEYKTNSLEMNVRFVSLYEIVIANGTVITTINHNEIRIDKIFSSGSPNLHLMYFSHVSAVHSLNLFHIKIVFVRENQNDDKSYRKLMMVICKALLS